jgi:hypothetical protein
VGVVYRELFIYLYLCGFTVVRWDFPEAFLPGVWFAAVWNWFFVVGCNVYILGLHFTVLAMLPALDG